MKWPFYLFFFILISCSQLVGRFPASNLSRHMVFDIDWTLVSEIKNPTKRDLKNKRVIEVQRSYYYVNDGVEEFVDAILEHPDMKVSFYSGGNKTRNDELLSKIKLKSQKSLKDVAYKILSKEDLVRVEGVPETAKFSERNKKDLSKISKNLDQLTMLDDTANFVLEANENQNEHVFFIGTSFEYFESYEDAEGKSGEYVPRSYREWLLDRKKMYILRGAFDEAYSESSTGTVTFNEAMKKQERLLNLQRREWNDLSLKYYRPWGNVGSPKKYLPLDCHQMTKAILGL